MGEGVGVLWRAGDVLLHTSAGGRETSEQASGLGWGGQPRCPESVLLGVCSPVVAASHRSQSEKGNRQIAATAALDSDVELSICVTCRTTTT